MEVNKSRNKGESLSLRHFTNILIFSFKLKAFGDSVDHKGYRNGYRMGYRTGYFLRFYIMRDLKITPRLITRRDRKVWHLDALIPKDLRHHNGGRDKLRRSCGSNILTYDEAVAEIDGETGNVLRGIVKEWVAENDPLIVCAERLLERLYGTYNKNGRILPKNKWLPSLIDSERVKNLKHYGREDSEEREEYNLILNILRGEVSKLLSPVVPLNKGNSLTDYDYIIEAVVEEVRDKVSFNKDWLKDTVEEVVDSDRSDSDMNYISSRVMGLDIGGGLKMGNFKEGEGISIEKRDYLDSLTMSEMLKEVSNKDISPEDLHTISKVYREMVLLYNTNKKQLCSKCLAELEDEHIRKRDGRGKVGVKLEDLILEFERRNIASIGRNKTLQEYRAKQRAFLEFAKNVDIADINAELMNDFIEHLFTEHNFARKTLKKYYTAIRQLITVAKDKGWIQRSIDPMQGFEIGNRGEISKPWDSFDDSGNQIRQLFSLDIPEQEKMLLQLLVCTGCRLNEMASIEWEDIKYDRDNVMYFDLTRPSLVVKEWKGSIAWSRRGVPIVGILRPLLDAWRVKTGGKGRLFNYRQREGTASKSASDILNPYIHRVRTPDQDNLVVHSIRGYFITLLALNGVDDTLRKIIVGQKPLGVDASYVNTEISQSARLGYMERPDFSFINTPRLEVSE
jgi:integrase